jgi:hypothetical protein
MKENFSILYEMFKKKIEMKLCSVDYAKGYLYCLIDTKIKDDTQYDEYARLIDEIDTDINYKNIQEDIERD